MGSVSIESSKALAMLRFSMLAGLNASLASVAGKVAFDRDFLVSAVFGGTAPAPAVLLAARGAAVAALLALNALLFRFVALGMSRAEGSVQVTAIVCAVNFLLSGVFGWLLFGEALSLRWALGAVLMVAGIGLLRE